MFHMRVRKLSEVAAGLLYREHNSQTNIQLPNRVAVHSVNIVHGDLTGVRMLKRYQLSCLLVIYQSNILIDANGMALLTDFGLSNVTAGAFGSYITSSIGGSVRWAPPEQFRLSRDYRISTVTTYGDIYSYGSVILQVRPTIGDEDTHALANHLSHCPDIVRESTLSSPETRRRGLA